MIGRSNRSLRLELIGRLVRHSWGTRAVGRSPADAGEDGRDAWDRNVCRAVGLAKAEKFPVDAVC